MIVPHRLVLRLAVPKQRYRPIQTTVLVPDDSLETTFLNHTSPTTVRPSPLERGHRKVGDRLGMWL